jgi:hypothetical protein
MGEVKLGNCCIIVACIFINLSNIFLIVFIGMNILDVMKFNSKISLND